MGNLKNKRHQTNNHHHVYKLPGRMTKDSDNATQTHTPTVKIEGSRIINIQKLQEYVNELTLHATQCGGSVVLTGEEIASLPGSCVGGVKSLVHTVCACSVTPGFLGLWKLADTTPQYHSVYHRIIVCCTHTIDDGGAFRRVWERG